MGSPDGGWDTISVPGAWTTQGFGAPQYTNVIMPFDLDPPAVPDRNPTGVYRRTVTVPRDWRGRRIVLRVGAAESVVVVLVDGQEVGLATDSRLPSEFDITDLVRPGRRSTVVLVVIKWSAQTWVEDQDQWWHGGIQRSVTLYSTAASHLEDAKLIPGLEPATDGTWTGTLDVEVAVAGPAQREPGWTVEVQVETEGGRRLAGTGPLDVPVWNGDGEASQLVSAVFVRPGVVSGRIEVRRAAPWSAESPTRHRAVVTLSDPSGTVVEVGAVRTGFRSVEVHDRQLQVNGAPVLIHGVNHHEHDPERGRAVSRELTRTDLLLMKAHNLNAVRASHYPHDEHFADLCDELGLYVVDEANVESHGRQASLCHDPRYGRTMVERVERMARRDKHHPSVIVWSLGNESGDGPPHAEAAAFLRAYDPSRPLHYEGPLMHDLRADAAVTDIVCPMYATIDDVVDRARWAGDRRRPVILCEYSHAMGNSNGSLADYWEAFERTPGLQGGFIWEWLEHGIPRSDLPGDWGYGGDFGDRPNDGNFICDGLVSADRVPHPAMEEVRHVGRPVRAEVVDASRGRVRLTNHRWFTDTSDLRCRWSLEVDGAVVDTGVLDVAPVAPRRTVAARIPFLRRLLDGAREAHLRLRWEQRGRTPWAPAGHLVGQDQFEVPVPPGQPHPVSRPDGDRAGGRGAGGAGVDPHGVPGPDRQRRHPGRLDAGLVAAAGHLVRAGDRPLPMGAGTAAHPPLRRRQHHHDLGRDARPRRFRSPRPGPHPPGGGRPRWLDPPVDDHHPAAGPGRRAPGGDHHRAARHLRGPGVVRRRAARVVPGPPGLGDGGEVAVHRDRPVRPVRLPPGARPARWVALAGPAGRPDGGAGGRRRRPPGLLRPPPRRRRAVRRRPRRRAVHRRRADPPVVGRGATGAGHRVVRTRHAGPVPGATRPAPGGGVAAVVRSPS